MPPPKDNAPTEIAFVSAIFEMSNTATKRAVMMSKYLNEFFILLYYTNCLVEMHGYDYLIEVSC